MHSQTLSALAPDRTSLQLTNSNAGGQPPVIIGKPDDAQGPQAELLSLESFLSSPNIKHVIRPPREAFYGLLGRIVGAVFPHTESDPVGLLVQILLAYGNIIGRQAHFVAEADQHYTNLNAVLVGQTSKGRKGASFGYVRKIAEELDHDWLSNHIQSGLSSGEGLIWSVRDNASIADKRILVYEPEFASVLANFKRDGNNLSATLRQCWDTGRLQRLTKNAATTATNAHISIVGHITEDELKRYLTTTEMANGFANRILWLYVRRSKCLPEGGKLEWDSLQGLMDEFRGAVVFGQNAGEMKRDQDARELWRSVYPELSEGSKGLFGAVTSRAEAQVMRIALIYCLLDNSEAIRKEHLSAALALWRYSEASAKVIFGDSLGDPAADALLRELRNQPSGMTRTEIRDFFSRNKKSEEVSRILQPLLDQKLARSTSSKTGGRPEVRWIATTITT